MIEWLKRNGLWPFHVDWAQWAPQLLDGLRMTLLFTVLGFTCAAALGLALALMRTSKTAVVRAPATVYTELFKNVPLIVIIYVSYFGLTSVGITLNVLQAGTLSLTVFYGAYLSEIFRSALTGVHGDQRQAAQALGLGRLATFIHVIFPQGLRLALPGTNTMLVDMLKSTSLLIVITAGELMSVGKSAASRTFEIMEVYLVIAAIYFAVCYPLSQALLWLERRVRAGSPLSPRRARRLRAARALLSTAEAESR
jgi:polar amino acid transport system permease protein